MSETETYTPATIAKMMTRIQALLAKAESTTFPEEAKSYRTKAEELMRTYRIEEEKLIAQQVTSGEPIWRDVPLAGSGNPWETVISSMFWNIAEFCGVKGMTEYAKIDGRGTWIGRVVGYDMDIRLLEMIFTSARLAFLARMEPEYDPALSAEENIYRLRGSGMDRQRVAELVFGKRGHQEGISVGKVYRAECERRGEVDGVSGRGFNAEAYRTAYADQFRTVIRRRLREAKDAADSTGGALVLPQRAERIQEALYVRYPSMRPETPEQRAEREARQAARQAEYLANETPAQRARREKEAKQVERRSRWTKADEVRWERIHGAGSERARAAGEQAARSVDFNRAAPKAQRAEKAPRAGEITA
jgi:hypothetical protein